MKVYEYVIKIKDQGIDKLRQLGNAGTSIRNTFRQIGSSMAGFGRQLRGVGVQVADFLGVSAALRFLPAAAAAGFALLGGRAVSLAADLEQTTVGFEVMLGSAEKANKMVTDLREFAKVTPFETSHLVKATEMLLGYGVAGEQIMPTLQMLGDVSRGNAEKLRLITYAYAQIQSTGRLLGQDLRQLTEAGFNPLKIMADDLSKSMGIKATEAMKILKKQMEDGNISAEMVTDAFRRATSEGGIYFNMMNKQSKTFSGIASTLRDEWNEALIDIGTRMLPTATEGVKALRSVLNDLTTRVDFAPLVKALVDTKDSLSQLLSMVGGGKAGALQIFFNTLAFSLRTGTIPLRLLIRGISLFIELASRAADAGRAFGMVLVGLATRDYGMVALGVQKATDVMGEGFQILKKEVSDFVKNEGKAYADIFTTGAKPVIPNVSQSWNPFGSALNADGTIGERDGAGTGGADGKVKDGIDRITGGGRQSVNVTINLENLVGVQNFDVTNVKESIDDLKEKVVKALLQTLNSANYAASQ